MESIELYFCRSLKLHFIQTRPFTQNSLTHTLSLCASFSFSFTFSHFLSCTLSLSYSAFLVFIRIFLVPSCVQKTSIFFNKALFDSVLASLSHSLSFINTLLICYYSLIPPFNSAPLSLWVFFYFLSALLRIK